jgi:hypothetical protein
VRGHPPRPQRAHEGAGGVPVLRQKRVRVAWSIRALGLLGEGSGHRHRPLPRRRQRAIRGSEGLEVSLGPTPDVVHIQLPRRPRSRRGRGPGWFGRINRPAGRSGRRDRSASRPSRHSSEAALPMAAASGQGG